MPFGLPAPRAAREQRAASIGALLRDIDALEQRVQEASKARPGRRRPLAAGRRACAEPSPGAACTCLSHAASCQGGMARRGGRVNRRSRPHASCLQHVDSGPGSPPRRRMALATRGAPRVLPAIARRRRAQVREARVRKAGIGGRARLAGNLREMDAEARARRPGRMPLLSEADATRHRRGVVAGVPGVCWSRACGSHAQHSHRMSQMQRRAPLAPIGRAAADSEPAARTLARAAGAELSRPGFFPVCAWLRRPGRAAAAGERGGAGGRAGGRPEPRAGGADAAAGDGVHVRLPGGGGAGRRAGQPGRRLAAVPAGACAANPKSKRNPPARPVQAPSRKGCL